MGRRSRPIDGAKNGRSFRPRRGIISLPLVVCLSAVLWSACREGPAEQKEIRLGLLAILQGVPRDTSGIPSVHGAELAVKTVNESGGVMLDGTPHRVVLVVKDYEDRADSATSVARALINQERIDALIGPQFSRHAIPVSVVAENARIPMVSPLSSSPATTEGKEFVFRLAFLDAVQGAVMGRFAVEELEASRAAVLYDISTAYGRNLAAVFRESFEQHGGRIVAFESYTRDQPLDYRELLARIGRTTPDVLYLPNDTERVAAQIRQAREQGLDITILGGDTWDMESFKLMPETNGSFMTHQWHPALDTREARDFVARYRKEYDETPKVTAAMTYDAVMLLVDVIERKGRKDADTIRAGLVEVEDFTGASGTIRFHGSPDPERAVIISKLENGKSKLYRIVDPE